MSINQIIFVQVLQNDWSNIQSDNVSDDVANCGQHVFLRISAWQGLTAIRQI